MDLKQIKELMTAMTRSQMKRLRIKDKHGFEIELETSASQFEEEMMDLFQEKRAIIQENKSTLPHAFATAMPQTNKEIFKENSELLINSPMVGTFYRAAGEGEEPFVKVGDRVDENKVVCIIEAMKVMNEVKAGKSGVIAEIYVDNGQPVEFGSKLFRLET